MERMNSNICNGYIDDKRILIVDDDIVTRNYLALLLQKDGFIPVHATGPISAVRALHQHIFSLAVIDLTYPEEDDDGYSLVCRIREAQPDCPVMIITSDQSAQTAVAAIRLRVDDYFLKPVNSDELLAAVRQYVSPEAEEGKRASYAMGAGSLTRRERMVLQMFQHGHSYKETARMMGCCIGTVQTYTKRIYKKMGVHSRSEATHEAIRLQVIRP